MAIVRCQAHPPQNTSTKIAVKPVGYPDTALICGRKGDGHNQPGWVFLRSGEYNEYQDGKRVFGLWGPDSSSTAAKVRLSDETVEGLNQWADSEEEDESGAPLQSQSSIDSYE